jgi:FKBP-type peptidyl-prolyl cis-trans isomerase (trigger factor)
MTDKYYSYTKAETSDGTIQLNLTINRNHISGIQDQALDDLAEEVTVPGFRKGKAPKSKIKEVINRDKLTRRIIERIIPAVYSEIIKTENIRPIVAPRVELITTEDDKDWQIGLLTCELPDVTLDDYKGAIKGELASKAIWTPDKGKDKKEKELTHDEKEVLVKQTLLKVGKVTIPKILVSEDVESRLSQLLERLEKLGLDLESYLASIGKTPQALRDEYEKQSQESLAIDLILNKISELEKTEVSEDEIKSAINAYAADEKIMEQLAKPEQQILIKSVLRRRKTLENLLTIAS